MAEAHIRSKLESSKISYKLQETVKEALSKAQTSITNKLGRLKAPQNSAKIQNIIKQQKPKPLQTEPPKKQRPNLQNQEARSEYFKEETQKAEENKKKIKEWYAEQKRREKKLKQKIQELQELQEQEKAKENQEMLKKHQEFTEKYKQELQKMQEKKQQRRLEMEEKKRKEEEYKQNMQKKPLYKKIEEKNKQLEKQEEDKIKQEISKIKENYVPVSKDKIKQHEQWYENLKKEKERSKSNFAQAPSRSQFRNNQSSYFNTHIKQILLKEKLEGDAKERAKQERLKMIEKRTQYAHLVKNMYAPQVDRFKQQEMKLRIERLKNPALPVWRKYSVNNPNQSTDEVTHNSSMSERSMSWKPKKYPVNPMVPKPKPKKEGKVVDYLKEFKENRKDTKSHRSLNWKKMLEAEDLSQVTEKAREVEELARKKEMRVPKNYNDPELVKETEEINDMIVSSIKAKMAALEKA